MNITTTQQVKAFLQRLKSKATVFQIIYLDKRTKNAETLGKLDITPNARDQIIQNLEITVNDTEQAGELLSGVGSRGADNVSSLQFVVEDEESVQREALVNAIADARENAEELAKALGVSLDKIVGYNELGGVSPMYRMEQSAMANDAGMGGASPQIPIGENRIQTGVQVIYKIR